MRRGRSTQSARPVGFNAGAGEGEGEGRRLGAGAGEGGLEHKRGGAALAPVPLRATRMSRRALRERRHRERRLRARLAIAAAAIITLGLTVFTFPYAAKWFAAINQQRTISEYSFTANQKNLDQFKNALDKNIAGDIRGAMAALDVAGTDAIGSVVIPAVSVEVPIYPSSSDADLQRGAGHIEYTSAPVGGPGTHSAISAHTGMPTASMFDRLHQAQVGDLIELKVLGETLTYQVSRIHVDTPEDGAARLQPREGADLLTLVTCTPYGVNTHRLLVTGVRVPDRDEVVEDAPDVTAKVPTPTWAIAYVLGLGATAAGASSQLGAAGPSAGTSSQLGAAGPGAGGASGLETRSAKRGTSSRRRRTRNPVRPRQTTTGPTRSLGPVGASRSRSRAPR